MSIRNENLGKKGKDILTDFEGTITGYCQYITGCDQYCLTPKCEKPNVKLGGEWFDVNRIKVLDTPILEIKTDIDKGSMDSPSVY